jgi:hypothetical protein
MLFYFNFLPFRKGEQQKNWNKFHNREVILQTNEETPFNPVKKTQRPIFITGEFFNYFIIPQLTNKNSHKLAQNNKSMVRNLNLSRRARTLQYDRTECCTQERKTRRGTHQARHRWSEGLRKASGSVALPRTSQRCDVFFE